MTEEQLPDLLRSLMDDDEFTDVIFGDVHAAESTETATYAASLVRALPNLVASSLWWAETLLKGGDELAGRPSTPYSTPLATRRATSARRSSRRPSPDESHDRNASRG